MERRLILHEILVNDILADGTRHVYFQEPSNVEMQYPCILYKQDDVDIKFADNETYQSTDRWMITIIDEDPDSPIRTRLISKLRGVSFNRRYIADQLNHIVFNLYF